MPDDQHFDDERREQDADIEAEREHEVVDQQVEQSAAARLRSFEDDYFGKDETRIAGSVQRGHGSRFAQMPPDIKAHYLALELAVEAEHAVSEARSALVGLEQKAETAEARVKATREAVKEWPAKAQE